MFIGNLDFILIKTEKFQLLRHAGFSTASSVAVSRLYLYLCTIFVSSWCMVPCIVSCDLDDPQLEIFLRFTNCSYAITGFERIHWRKPKRERLSQRWMTRKYWKIRSWNAFKVRRVHQNTNENEQYVCYRFLHMWTPFFNPPSSQRKLLDQFLSNSAWGYYLIFCFNSPRRFLILYPSPI